MMAAAVLTPGKDRVTSTSGDRCFVHAVVVFGRRLECSKNGDALARVTLWLNTDQSSLVCVCGDAACCFPSRCLLASGTFVLCVGTDVSVLCCRFFRVGVSTHGSLISNDMFHRIHIVECSSVRACVARGSCVHSIHARNPVQEPP